MTTKTRTATTAHGDVEYETIECMSCGAESPKEDSYRVIIGRVKSIHHWGYKNSKEYDLVDHTVSDGRICELCREQGPAGYPQPGEWSVNRTQLAVAVSAAMATALVVGLAIGVMLL